MREIQAAQYEAEVLGAPEPVVLDFFSTECPPCEALAPKFEAVADQFKGRVRFLAIFGQGNRDLAAKLAVTSSPTLLFYKGGKEVGSRTRLATSSAARSSKLSRPCWPDLEGAAWLDNSIW